MLDRFSVHLKYMTMGKKGTKKTQTKPEDSLEPAATVMEAHNANEVFKILLYDAILASQALLAERRIHN